MVYTERKKCSRSAAALVISVGFLLVCHGAAAQYSHNLNDIQTRHPITGHLPPIYHEPTPIGDLGAINTVVDLRGFVPMEFMSKTYVWNPLRIDKYVWYSIPTKKALLMLYTGTLPVDHIADDSTKLEEKEFRTTQFLDEDQVKGETAQWSTVAYDLAEKNGSKIFEQVAGSGFQSAEPSTILFTKTSVFIVLSFKYSISLTDNGGQVLLAMEFSRALKRYKNIYTLHSTTMMSKSTGEMFTATAIFVGKALIESAISPDQ